MIVSSCRTPIISKASSAAVEPAFLVSLVLRTALEKKMITKTEIQKIVFSSSFPKDLSNFNLSAFDPYDNFQRVGFPGNTMNFEVLGSPYVAMDANIGLKSLNYVNNMIKAQECQGVMLASFDLHSYQNSGFGARKTEKSEKDPLSAQLRKACKVFDIKKKALSEFETKSFEKFENARKKGFFNMEIASVPVLERHKQQKAKLVEKDVLFEDEKFKMITTPDGKLDKSVLGKLDGNQFFDGKTGESFVQASAMTIFSEKKIKSSGLSVIGKIAGFEITKSRTDLPRAIVSNVKNLLNSKKLAPKDVGAFEISEMITAIPLLFSKQLKIEQALINKNGGCFSMGDTHACGGVRMVETLANTIRKEKKQFGVAVSYNIYGETVACLIENSN